MKTEIATADPSAADGENLVFLYPPKSNPYLQQVKLRLKSRKSLQVMEALSANQIMNEVERSGSGLLFLGIRTNDDLTRVLKCLKDLQGLIQTNALRVLALTDIETPRALMLLRGRGCTDVFPTRLMWSSLENNINHALSLLTMHRLMHIVPKRKDDPVDFLGAEAVHPESMPTENDPFDPELATNLKVWV